jgi:hypothetical protein
MSRWIGYAVDPSPGGSTYDLLSSKTTKLAVPAPTIFVPATTAQVEPQLQPVERKDEIRGRRGEAAPAAFASAPNMTFSVRAYPALVNDIIRHALGGTVATEGIAPAAITSKVQPMQEGNLPPLVLWLLREGQLDRLTGAIVAEFVLHLPIDQEGHIEITTHGLFHDVQDPTKPMTDPGGEPAAAFPTPAYSQYQTTLKMRDCVAFMGPGEGVEVPDLAGLTLTFNNGMITDFHSRFRPNHNIESKIVGGELHKLWYPEKHKIGPQAVSGTIELSAVDPESEAKHMLHHAERLMFQVAAGQMATTPASTEMLRIVLYKQAFMEGGADPLVREGDQRSTFTFHGYIDEATNQDIEMQAVAKAALV